MTRIRHYLRLLFATAEELHGASAYTDLELF